MNVVQAVSELPPPLPGYVRVVRVESPHDHTVGGISAARDGGWWDLPTPYGEGYKETMLGTLSRYTDGSPVCGAHPDTFHRWFDEDTAVIDRHELGIFCFDVPGQHAWKGNLQVVFKRHEARLIARLH